MARSSYGVAASRRCAPCALICALGAWQLKEVHRRAAACRRAPCAFDGGGVSRESTRSLFVISPSQTGALLNKETTDLWPVTPTACHFHQHRLRLHFYIYITIHHWHV